MEATMAKPEIAALQRQARETFGRELSAAQIEAYRGRLPTMLKNVQILDAWQERLRGAHPALIQRVPGGGDHG